jgi:hypothetical protein
MSVKLSNGEKQTIFSVQFCYKFMLELPCWQEHYHNLDMYVNKPIEVPNNIDCFSSYQTPSGQQTLLWTA